MAHPNADATFTQNSQGPKLYQVAIIKESGRDVARWVDPPELKSAHHPCYWIEGETQWQGYAGVSGARVACLPGVPVILLRRPDVQQLLGLGDVLEYLENVRAIQRASGEGPAAMTAVHAARARDPPSPQAGPSNVKEEAAARAQTVGSVVISGYDSDAYAAQAGPSTLLRPVKVEPSAEAVKGKETKKDKGKGRDMGTDWRRDVEGAGFRVLVENGEEVIEI